MGFIECLHIMFGLLYAEEVTVNLQWFEVFTALLYLSTALRCLHVMLFQREILYFFSTTLSSCGYIGLFVFQDQDRFSQSPCSAVPVWKETAGFRPQRYV